MKKTVSGILLMFLLIGMWTLTFKVQPVKAATITVPDDYSTIQDAVNHANFGDTVYVRNGVYREHVEINKTITLTGESNRDTIIEAWADGTLDNGICVNSSSVTIENFNITAARTFGGGVIFINGSGCPNNVIRNNNIAPTMNGTSDTLEIWGSSGNIVEGNQITLGSSSDGIAVSTGTNNTIKDNTVMGGWTCIAIIISNYNTVSNNYVIGQTTLMGFPDIGAIALMSDGGNVVFGNMLVNNSIGLSAYVADCSVYHNGFINNTQQSLIENASQVTFDNRYPSGGNYWSDYNGTDSYRGQYQNLTGSDGIGDTPYTVDANNIDHYPLMNPWSPHDIAVTNVLPSKTVVGQGYNLIIYVPVANLGDYTENFNVTVYANTSVVASAFQNVTLPAGASGINLVFMCTTTSLAYGNYTISAYAWPVQGETNKANNNCTGGNLFVTIPGDINGDFKVSLQDLMLLANAYGSSLGNAKWNPNADLDNDGTVNLQDLVILAQHYGQHNP